MSRADDLGRLREEIETGHRERAEFVTDMKQTVVDMQSGFRKAHGEMAKDLRGTLDANEAKRIEEAENDQGERVQFVTDIKETVGDMQAGFRDAHAKMAEEQRATLDANEAERIEEAENDQGERVQFVTDIKETVADMRKENQAENEAAHQAWAGTSPVVAVATEEETEPKKKAQGGVKAKKTKSRKR